MGQVLAKFSSGFVIRVKTGDSKKAGTDSNIKIILYDDASNASTPILLNQFFKNNFERGLISTFQVSKDEVSTFDGNANITRIELWRDNAGISCDWLVDTITIENTTTKKSFIFPIFRWIRSDYHYQVKHYDTSLPQKDAYPEQRKMELEQKKELYVYAQKIDAGPVQVKEVPADENFSFGYQWSLLTLGLKLKSNSGVKKRFAPGKFEKLEDLTKVYDKVFPKPFDFDGWKKDVYFGYQRTAGPNPFIIKLASEIPDKFPVTDATLGGLLGGLTLQDAKAQKRLFICDYQLMDGIPVKEGYKICHPIVLFFVNNDDELVPVAIQLYQIPGQDNPIFTPEDSPMLWCMVKMWVNNADAAYHQAITHLGNTHLMMEGVAISVNRTISQSHPMYKILAPHFLYIIAINDNAVQSLIPPGAWIDNNMTAASAGTLELTRRGYDSWTMDVDGTLPGDLKNRGLDDPKVLPTYHAREDAMELYQAINKYVTSYVNHYYTSNEMLQNDEEIQNWARELVAERRVKGVGLKGVPGNGQLTSTDQLIQIVTCVIMICSVTHAAANFPQYDQYCYPPNYPALMNGDPPVSKDTTVTEEDILNTLPDRPSMLDTMVITKLLSMRATQSLGDFEVQHIYEPEAIPFVEEFKKDLQGITANIESRNAKRKFVYNYLDPAFIPNSISI